MLVNHRCAYADSSAVSVLVVTEKVYRDLGAAFNIFGRTNGAGNGDGVSSFHRPEEFQVDRASVVKGLGPEELAKAFRGVGDGHSP